MIEAEAVWREFAGNPRPALADVSFRLARGERALLLGPSGSGKSTLINLLAGLDRPTRGRVSVMGEDFTRLGETALSGLRGRVVSVMFQHHFLPPGMSARETVAAPLLWTKRMSPQDAEDHAEHLLAQLGLNASEIRRPVENLSGGQRQRVAFARAVAPGPSILLCDEPLAQLDPENGRRLVDAITEWSEDPERVLVVALHQPVEALAGVCGIQLKLQDGRMVE